MRNPKLAHILVINNTNLITLLIRINEVNLINKTSLINEAILI